MAIVSYFIWPHLFEIKEILLSISFINWTILLALQIVTVFLLALQWRLIINNRGGNANCWQMVYVQMVGSFFESITPSAKFGGEAVRIFMIRNYFHTKKLSIATAIITLQKIYSMFTFIVIFFIFTTGFVRQFTFSITDLFTFNFNKDHLPITLIILCFIGIISYVVFKKFAANKLIMLKNGWGSFKETILSSLTNQREIVSQLIISSFVWMLYPIKGIILGTVLHLEINFTALTFIIFASYLVAQLPVTPGGIGTFEGTMIILLTKLNIDFSSAFIFTTVFRFVTHWFLVLASVPFLYPTKDFKHLRRKSINNHNNK